MVLKVRSMVPGTEKESVWTRCGDTCGGNDGDLYVLGSYENYEKNEGRDNSDQDALHLIGEPTSSTKGSEKRTDPKDPTFP